MTTQLSRLLPRLCRLLPRPLRLGIPFVCLASVLAPAVSRAQAPAVAAPAPAAAASQEAAVDTAVQRSMQARQFPGASVAVIKDGKVVVAKGYGLSDVDKSIKATEQTVYQLASVTKPFTAMATLMLVEGGKLSLDGKVTEILPGLPAAWAPVTVRHLLTHTSGIKSYTDVFGEAKVADSQVFTPDQILALVKDAPLAFTPGDKYAYCNTGYYLLGMIIEKASGKPYAAFLAERIFKPLGMTSTSLDDYADARPLRARGYSFANGQTTPAEHTHPTQPFSAGALVSTVVDLATWDAALTGRKLLTPASYDLMWTPMRFNSGTQSHYALGWEVQPYRTRPRQAHGGGIAGFSTFVARFPDDKVTVIALVNQSGGAGQAVANGIAEIYVPALKENAPKPIADPDPTITAFLKQALTSAAGGTIDPEWLTPEFRSFMLPDRIKQGPDMMGRHGPLQAFELMEDHRTRRPACPHLPGHVRDDAAAGAVLARARMARSPGSASRPPIDPSGRRWIMAADLDAARIRGGTFDGSPESPAALARLLADAARARAPGLAALEEALRAHVGALLRSGDPRGIGLALTHLDVEARAGAPVAVTLFREAYAAVDSPEWSAWAEREPGTAAPLRDEVLLVADQAARRIASGTCGAG